MVFSSLSFLFLFLPVFFGCYYLAPARARNAVLLAGSLCFYFFGTREHPEHLILFLVSILLDFFLGLLIERRPRYKKAVLCTGVFFHLACLGTFKYAGLGLTLPIGISFYSFQGISYLADVYRRRVPAEKSLLRFGVYLAMFEQLIAGPIVPYDSVRRRLARRKIPSELVFKGIRIFILGLALKVLLANPIGKLWTDVERIGFESISTPLAWMAIFAFSFQIYFDFFGYSLMAVGLGHMLGFSLPKNFCFPYLSRSMTEFWRRWHITLGNWFREYIYIPLGGNRKGPLATTRNLLLVWLLTGLWHGAGLHFLLWGAVLFLLIWTEKFLIGDFLEQFPLAGHLYMLILIPLTWSLFAIEELPQLGLFFSRLFPFFGQGPWSVFRYDYLKYLKLYAPFFLAGILFSTRLPFRLLKKLSSGVAPDSKWKKTLRWCPSILLLAASVFFLYRGMNDPFLYFRF